MTDTSVANRASWVILGSLKWGTDETPSEDQTVGGELGAGDMLVIYQ